ncbi:hypothetical protein BCF11_2730 [Collimonas sp. PA-H2]|uniref:hypothetical protein n=1 Tax=Collimonas sp. PA-H2 TaxID=1881062 RepID=UPI000BF7E854|nr:hypothetical protein [Collimonas sp. PA-H2]PFH10312.1 hypothetical protein BCF11_2730 [Collimonas sp. PA-H2]
MALRIVDKLDLEVMYEAERSSYNQMFRELVTKQIYLAETSGYQAIGFELDGRCIGGAMLCPKYAHFSVLPEYHGTWTFLWRQTLEWIFAQRCPAYAPVHVDNVKCRRFMQRNNWEIIDTVGEFQIYEMDLQALTRLATRRYSRISQTQKMSAHGL